MLKRLWEGFVEDATMLVLLFFLINLFIDIKQGTLFGAMLVWLILEILENHLDISGKLKMLLDKIFKKN